MWSATRNEATSRLKPPKMTPLAELTAGTAIRPSRERLWTVPEHLQTVANGRGQKRNVERAPRVKWDPLLRIGEKVHAGVARCAFPSKAKVSKTDGFGMLLEVDVQKVHTLAAGWRMSKFKVSRADVFKLSCKLRCRKGARRCGTKHMWKSKV